MTIPISLQLYTLRDALAQDLAGTMEKIAEVGFIGVETAYFGDAFTPAQAAEVIKANGLSIMATHCELPLGNTQQMVLEWMETFGCELCIWHGWPRHADYSSVDGVKRLADLYNQANGVAQVHGLRFGIHNHWWEFEPVGDTYPYRILQAEMDESIFFEVDTYWVRTAGLDPAAVLRELGDRVPLLHIKDGPATQEGNMVAAGTGIMDFLAVFAASKPQWAVVELDRCGTDMLTAVRQSYDYLTSSGFAYGKR